MKRFVLSVLAVITILITAIYGLVQIVENQNEELNKVKTQLQELKLENKRLENELKPYREAESYIRNVNPKAVHRTGQIVNGARKHGLPLKLVLVATHAESDFQWGAIGKAGEHGPLQVMPDTFKMVHQGDFTNAEHCFEAGLKYMAMCYRKARGDHDLTLAYYNGGLSRKNPLYVARAHVNRCNSFRRRML